MRNRTHAAPATLLALSLMFARDATAQRYLDSDGALRLSLAEQPLSPNGRSAGPRTMATGGIQEQLERLGMSLGHFADIVAWTSSTRAR